MVTKIAPPVTALDVQSAANLFLLDHRTDRFLADDPRLDYEPRRDAIAAPLP